MIKSRLPAGWQDRYGFTRWWAGRAWRAVSAGVSPLSYLGHYALGRWRLRVHGVPVSTRNRRVAWQIANDIYEKREYDIPGFVVQPGWRVVDVGAHIGLFAMLAASRGARVVSFEPHPDSAAHLRANTAKWDVECHEAAVVGAPSGPLRLYVHPQRDTRNSLVPRDVGDGTALTAAVEVPTVTLAEALGDGCDLLKLDIEGAEFELFTAARDALAKADRIIAELHPFAGDPDDAVRQLEAAGFDVRLRPSIHAAGWPSLTAVRRAPAAGAR
jgi:FkbM family methyltransferase